MAIIAGVTMMLAGCVSTDQKRLSAAAGDIGRIKTGVNLPDLPEECRQKMARVFPKYGTEKPRNTQLRWEFAADFVDRRTGRCADFYNGVKTRFASE
ncbi:hypothetical protein [Agrobacterium rosae]|uniref:hypothetical protein n=1 Tax=Agrobacterium rosae TaxID=1972867 RepID=UPI003B9ED66A